MFEDGEKLHGFVKIRKKENDWQTNKEDPFGQLSCFLTYTLLTKNKFSKELFYKNFTDHFIQVEI